MCIVFLLILNARNDGIVDRVSYLDVARKEKVGVFIQHPVAVPPQVVIACRKGGREGEGVVESERISADFLSFHNGVGTVDQFRNDKITLCVVLMGDGVHQITFEPYLFSGSVKRLVQMEVQLFFRNSFHQTEVSYNRILHGLCR